MEKCPRRQAVGRRVCVGGTAARLGPRAALLGAGPGLLPSRRSPPRTLRRGCSRRRPADVPPGGAAPDGALRRGPTGRRWSAGSRHWTLPYRGASRPERETRPARRGARARPRGGCGDVGESRSVSAEHPGQPAEPSAATRERWRRRQRAVAAAIDHGPTAFPQAERCRRK